MKGTKSAPSCDPLRGAHKDVRRFAAELLEQGLVLARTKRNHVVVLTPSGTHVGTFGINRISPVAAAKCRRQIRRALAHSAAWN